MGYGSMRRKEDARFIRGRGRYLDDIVLPGMLHGAVLRSPYAHARIVSVDTSAAEAHPKVKAVITGETLAGLGLAWMPTLSHDVQAVLATDKVRFQGQEVAFVVAEDRYAARDALGLIEVEYEPLPAGHRRDARRWTPDAPVIRDDLEGRTDNHIFDWEAGDAAATDEVFAGADVVSSCDMLYPRCTRRRWRRAARSPSMDPVTGKLTVYTTTQAPHAHRTVYALVAGPARAQDPGHRAGHRRRLRQQGRDLPRLRLRGRRLHRHRRAGEVGRGPLREPDEHLVRPRLPHARARSRRRRTASSSGCG